MADIHGDPRDAPQMPQAAAAGAPVPYRGPDERPEPPLYSVGDTFPVVDHPLDIVHGIPQVTGLSESAAATDMGPLAVSGDAPYYPGPFHTVNAAGDDDPGGRSDAADNVAGAVANAQARWQNLMGDHGHTGTPGPGAQPVHAGQIGDLIQFPAGPLDPGAGVGNTIPTGGFYDPTREYGGAQGAPAYGGEQGLPPAGQQGRPQ